MKMNDKCINCGGIYEIHQYTTLQCPPGGVEQPLTIPQRWLTTTFECIDTRDAELAQLRATVAAQAEQITALQTAVREAREIISSIYICEIDFCVECNPAPRLARRPSRTRRTDR
jgi:hypothetical protein